MTLCHHLHRHPYSRTFGVLIMMGMLLSGLSGIAYATAEEESPFKESAFTPVEFVHGAKTPPPASYGMAPPETVAMNEGPVTPWGASETGSQASEAFRRQILLVSNYIQNRNRRLGSDDVGNTARAIVQFSNRYGVDFRLLTSLISTESSFRRDAVSSSGAIGMGQLKPDTARWLGVVNPYDPVDNIAGTARFLAWLLQRYNGRLEYALSAYYQGPGYVDQNGISSVCLPYLQKVNRALDGLL